MHHFTELPKQDYILIMKTLSHIFLAGLTLAVLACATVSMWVLEPMITKQKFLVIPAIEKTIKIRPMKTSCMPFTTKEVTYNRTESICEKKGDIWVNLNGLACQTLETINSDGSRPIKASEEAEEEMIIKVSRTVDGKRILRRAPSIIGLKSCNNDI